MRPQGLSQRPRSSGRTARWAPTSAGTSTSPVLTRLCFYHQSSTKLSSGKPRCCATCRRRGLTTAAAEGCPRLGPHVSDMCDTSRRHPENECPTILSSVRCVLCNLETHVCAGQLRERLWPSPYVSETEKLLPNVALWCSDTSEVHCLVLRS